jgi:chaperone modulatory protein CbpM
MKKLLTGEVLDDQIKLTLSELCLACGHQEEWIIKLVDEGVLEPSGENQLNWRFSGVSLRTVHSAMRLERDLGINIEGVALALELIEEVEQLRYRLKLYEDPNN